MKKRTMNEAGRFLGTVLLCGGVVSSCSNHIDQPASKGPEVLATPYITKVLEFVPCPGQFVNVLPEFEEGDTQEAMNEKVLQLIGNNKRGLISLGGFGGYVVVGFDHTIENKPGSRDFRVLGNAFNGNSSAAVSGATKGGSYEPGIILVAYDKNGNGKPDADEWYEIQGSAQQKGYREPWYVEAECAGNDVNCYADYEITYYKPQSEPSTPEEDEKYIRWTDNKGGEGYIPKNEYHRQPYFPQWIQSDKLTFKGTRLPQNAINRGTEAAPYFVLFSFAYGYADNALNDSEGAAIDIDWAVDANGAAVHLPGVDFVKIYTGVNQVNGWLGECSTELMGVEDLHLLENRKL